MGRGSVRSMRQRSFAGVVIGLAAVALTVSACTAGSPGKTDQAAAPATAGSSGTATSGSSAAPSSSAATPAAVLTLSPGSGATGVSPVSAITAAVAGGTLESVSLVNSQGKAVSGALDADKTSWKAGEALGYGKTYTLTAKATNADGRAVAKKTTFTTVTPGNMTQPYINSTAGSAMTNGATYGVGIVPVVHFDEAISDKAAAEKMLSVTTSPAVTGSWYWVDDQNVHFRPQNYYKTGTKVTVKVSDYGKQVSPGLWGQSDAQVSFTIGAKHVSIADDNTKQVRVYFNDKFQRSMPTSMGRGGSTTGSDGQTITFWTQRGTYTVLDKSNPVLMDSSTYGLPINSRLGYKEEIPYATRISTDGVYLHELDTTVWAQGNTDTSHGCLNLNGDNAAWFFNFSVPGDVVEVKNTGGPPLKLWQNGDWTIPWDQWRQGSKLA